MFWPCPSESHHGTPRLFVDRFSTATGKARFHAVRHLPPGEEPDAAYPHYLTTGRVLAQYQSGTQTRRYGLADGDTAVLATRRGEATFKVRLTQDIREDTIFAPFHWPGEQSANRLTNPALDPISRMPEFKLCAVSVRRA